MNFRINILTLTFILVLVILELQPKLILFQLVSKAAFLIFYFDLFIHSFIHLL